MGLRSWWRKRQEQATSTRRSLEINSNQDLIATQVPELAGMSEVAGMAYVLAQIKEWKSLCSAEEAVILAQRLQSSHQQWEDDGLTMPYWGNLWVLRNLQRELGYEAPLVALPVSESQEAYLSGEAAAKEAVAALEQYATHVLKPRRKAFIEVLEKQLATLDARVAQHAEDDNIDRSKLAAIDYQVMLENWEARMPTQLIEATEWMKDHIAVAETVGSGAKLHQLISGTLDQQRDLLVRDGAEILVTATAR